MTRIGKNVILAHNGLGVVINRNAIIGEGSIIFQNVTIGGRDGRGAPIIGKNCFIGPGVCILGGVKIGNNVSIGANSIVINNIPDNTTVVAPLGRIIYK